MKRMTGVVAAAAAATLILAGCGNETSGNASGASPAANEQTTNQQTTDQQTTGGADSSAGGDSTDSDSTGGESSGGQLPGGESSGGASANAPTTTFGADAQADETTVAWMTTFCEGIKPGMEQMKNFGSAASASGTDPKSMMTKLAGPMETMGKSFTDTAAALKDKPAPTFSGGEAFAKTVVDGMGTMGGKVTEVATAMKNGDMAKVAEMQSTMTDLGKTFSGVTTDPAAQKVFLSVPACKEIKTAMGG